MFYKEAIAVGLKMALAERDTVITAYRCHAFAVVFGVPIRSVLAEVMGRKTGAAKGKGGSMHMYAPRFYGGDGIVGGQVNALSFLYYSRLKSHFSSLLIGAYVTTRYLSALV